MTIALQSKAGGTQGSLQVNGIDALLFDSTGMIGGDTPVLNKTLGIGQTWQNMLATRVNNVNYTNDTGKPIVIYARGAHASLGIPFIQLFINGTIEAGYMQLGQSGSGVSGDLCLSAIVPAGAVYSIGSSTGIVVWSELR